MKTVTFVARKPEMAAERFRMLWIGEHGTTARQVPGIAGLVLSEALQDSAAAAPGAPYPLAFDGIETAWFASAGGADGRPWSTSPGDRPATAASIVDESASRRFVASEQVVMPPPIREGAIKRTLLMVRKQGLSREEFMERWTIGHAKLAVDVPGLLGCVFNHVLPAPAHSGTPEAAIDGVAELWWEGRPGNPGTRVVAAQADAWLADGDAFTDRDRTRVIVSLDHVIIPPPSARGAATAPAALSLRPQ
jgi:hypothetical protein